MKKKQTRFTTEQQIIDKIDETKSKLKSIQEECEHYECLSFRNTDDEDRLNKLRKSAVRIEDATLPKLKNTLAAFRTETMAFCGDDKGVVLGG